MILLRHNQSLERSRRRAAFTLLEVLIVVSIIVILAGIGGYYMFRAADDAKEGVARTNAMKLAKACEVFQTKYNRLPESLQELVQPPDGMRPYAQQEELLDPWGKPYQYDPAGTHNGGQRPDVFTTSPGNVVIGNWTPGQ